MTCPTPTPVTLPNPNRCALVHELPAAVRRNCPGLLRHVRDDIAQSAAAAVLARVNKAPTTEVNEAYVRRVAKNAIIDVVRKETRRDHWWSMHRAALHVREPRDPEHELMGRELARRVDVHLQQLPTARREVVSLYLEGYGISEIADRLGCNRKRADNLVRRGLATLRQNLLDEGLAAA